MSVILTERLVSPGKPSRQVYLINTSYSQACEGSYELRVESSDASISHDRQSPFLLGPREEEVLLTYLPGERNWQGSVIDQRCWTPR